MIHTLIDKTDSMIEKIAAKLAELGASVAMGAKILLQHTRPSRPRKAECPHVSDDDTIIIMGNGPSLRDTLTSHSEVLKRHRLMAVNFAANTPEFTLLKPCDYVLADPHFFEGQQTDENVKRLWENIARADWPIQLHVPVKYAGMARRLLSNSHVHIATFSMIPTAGLVSVARCAMKHRQGMPRPRNVMIPAIMQAIHSGYKNVVLVGADHTWTRTLCVDENNCVVNFQTHFYADSKSERSRQAKCHTTVHLHNILESMAIAFRSYHEVADYAHHCNTIIYNATTDTFIDAFPRRSLHTL